MVGAFYIYVIIFLSTNYTCVFFFCIFNVFVYEICCLILCFLNTCLYIVAVELDICLVNAWQVILGVTFLLALQKCFYSVCVAYEIKVTVISYLFFYSVQNMLLCSDAHA